MILGVNGWVIWVCEERKGHGRERVERDRQLVICIHSREGNQRVRMKLKIIKGRERRWVIGISLQREKEEIEYRKGISNRRDERN